ncbi:MAG: CPBP family intramembrane metalloprotease [Clostridia bacterium]|nr:CPBP family intramembrane metalloprotease [Clostridia bacterium]
MSKDRINGALTSILKAAAFFGIYFLSQVVAIIAFVFIFAFIEAFKGVTDINAIASVLLEKTMELTIISNVIAVIGCIVLLIWFRTEDDGLAEKLDFRLEFDNMWKVIGFSLALGVFGQLAISLILNIIPFPASWIEMQNQSADIIISSPLFIQIIGVAIMAPLAEEIIFRACIQGTLERGLPAWASILITSVIFGLMHGTPISFIYATTLGILMGWLYHAFKSIVPSMLFHFGFNTLSLFLSEDTPLFFFIASFVVFGVCLGFLIYYSIKNRDYY